MVSWIWLTLVIFPSAPPYNNSHTDPVPQGPHQGGGKSQQPRIRRGRRRRQEPDRRQRQHRLLQEVPQIPEEEVPPRLVESGRIRQGRLRAQILPDQQRGRGRR